jgi:two-component system, LytTR family, sensor kinase
MRGAGVLAFWTACAAVYATHLRLYHLVRSQPTTFVRQFGEAMAHCMVWALLTPVVIWMVRRVPLYRSIRWRNVATHAAAALAVALIQVALHAAAEMPLHQEWSAAFLGERLTRLFARTFSANLIVYGTIAGLFTAIDVAVERRSSAARLEAELANARLDALQARIHPHFLFNGLNSIAALIREEPARAEEMISTLGRLLRSAVRRDGRLEIPLREELQLVDHYLQIEKLRFDDRLHVAVDVSEEAGAAMVPPLLLQPLVENAILHGMTRRRALHITIGAATEGDQLKLQVTDDGTGIRDEAREGFGIPSARERLRQLHGERFVFSIAAASGGGSDVRIVMPYREGG